MGNPSQNVRLVMVVDRRPCTFLMIWPRPKLFLPPSLPPCCWSFFLPPESLGRVPSFSHPVWLFIPLSSLGAIFRLRLHWKRGDNPKSSQKEGRLPDYDSERGRTEGVKKPEILLTSFNNGPPNTCYSPLLLMISRQAARAPMTCTASMRHAFDAIYHHVNAGMQDAICSV